MNGIKYLAGLCLALSMAVICCSCAFHNEKEADLGYGTIITPAKEKVAGKELLEAFIKNRPQAFLKLLPAEVRNQFGVNGFKQTRASMVKQLGEPVSYSFVTNLKHPSFTVSIWKILFVRKSSDGKKQIRQEGMFRAVSGTLDGKERFLGFNFF